MTNIDFSAYLDSKMVIVVVALVFLGTALKSLKFIQDTWIPLILGAAGVVFGCFIIGPTAMGVIQGLIATAVAVYTNQLFKQAEKVASNSTITNNSGSNTEKVDATDVTAKVEETNSVQNSNTIELPSDTNTRVTQQSTVSQ